MLQSQGLTKTWIISMFYKDMIQEQLDIALSRIDVRENRSSRYRIRSLPESRTDIPTAVQVLIKDLIPNIPPHRLELNRAHRAPGHPQERWFTKRCGGQTPLLCGQRGNYEKVPLTISTGLPRTYNRDFFWPFTVNDSKAKISKTTTGDLVSERD